MSSASENEKEAGSLAPLVVDGFVPGVLSDSEVVFSDFRSGALFSSSSIVGVPLT